MRRLVKLSIAVLGGLLSMQSIRLIQYLLNHSDTELFTLGVVCLITLCITVVGSVVYIAEELWQNRK